MSPRIVDALRTSAVARSVELDTAHAVPAKRALGSVRHNLKADYVAELVDIGHGRVTAETTEIHGFYARARSRDPSASTRELEPCELSP
jgi:hypothetical protein